MTCVMRGCSRAAYQRRLCRNHYALMARAGVAGDWMYRRTLSAPPKYHPAPRTRPCAQCDAPYGVQVGPANRLDPDLCSTICQTARQDGAPVCNLVGQGVAA